MFWYSCVADEACLGTDYLTLQRGNDQKIYGHSGACFVLPDINASHVNGDVWDFFYSVLDQPYSKRESMSFEALPS
jgi:hypothetical protein